MTPLLHRPLLSFVAALLLGGAARGEIEDLPGELLSGNESPEPDWSKVLDGWIKEDRPIPELPPDETGPPESASPADLLAYWRNSWPWEKGQEPSPVMRAKTLEAVKAKAAAIPEALRALPQSDEAARAILELLPQIPADTAESVQNLRQVRAWIFRHSGMLREEVIADARQAEWESYLSYEDGDDSLQALKDAEPAVARKVFEELAKWDNPGLVVIAARLLAEMTEADEAQAWRDKLIAAAANPKIPERARQLAVASLSRMSWPGKEAWFIGSLKLEDPGRVYWFNHLLFASPDRWIEPLLGLIGGENRDAHNRAVLLLVQLSDRPEAIRPLLPWLKDPKWAEARYAARAELIKALTEVKLPECVPDLRHLILHDDDEGCVVEACRSLPSYQGKEALPDIKAAISRLEQKDFLRELAEIIQGLGGFSDEEIASSIAASFTGVTTPAASIGSYFVKELPIEQLPAELLAKQAEDLMEKDPFAATELRTFIATSPHPAGRRVLGQLLASGELEEETLAKVLEWRRENREKWDGSTFLSLTESRGVAGGIAAVLSGERKAMDQALASDDFHKQHAVIAAAWLSQDALDIDQLAKLHALGQDDDEEDEKEPTEEQEELADAAWQYLICSEDPKAVSFVNKQRGDPLAAPYGGFGFTPDVGKLAKERASEIFSMSQMLGGGGHGSRSLIVFPDRVVATRISHGGRSGSCVIAPEKVAALRNYVSTYHADELPNLDWGMADGVEYYFSHATADGTKSVHMSNPPENRDSVLAMLEEDGGRFSKGVVLYGQLMWQFNQVFQGLKMDYGYGPGVEILSPREEGEARSVWKEGGDLRVLVNEDRSGPNWRQVSLADKTLLDTVAEPPGYFLASARRDLHPDFRISSDYHFRYPWQVRSGDATIHAGKYRDVEGLWRCRVDQEPELVATGNFLNELVSADGQWCVASKAIGENWAEPNTVVRIKLATKEVFPVNLEVADDFHALAFVEAHGKFLIRRSRDHFDSKQHFGPAKPEFHLMDPASGELEKVNGNFSFWPMHGGDPRLPQPTGEAFTVWVVDTAPHGGLTVVGKYDQKAFTFTPIAEIEDIRFDSPAMWVDETEGMIYAAVNGDLVRVPMKKE